VGLETPPDKSIVANEALRAACRKLNITPPKLFLIEDEQLLGTIQCLSPILGLANSATRSIYIRADQSFDALVRCVLHECWHIYDTTYDKDEEIRADAFVFRCWVSSYANLSDFVEIMRALEGIGTGTVNRTSSKANHGSYLNTNSSTSKNDAEQQRKKVAEVRANYYSKGIQARAELHLKPKSRGYFPADIEFHNQKIHKVICTDDNGKEW
jgi:hypothetical protein